MDLTSFGLSQYKAGSTNMMLVKIAYQKKIGFTVKVSNYHRDEFTSFVFSLTSKLSRAAGRQR